MEKIINSYLSALIELEVSGKEAISAPSNWLKEPLLNVKTDIDEDVERISPSLLIQDNDAKLGAWWFLIGSPGNGKSAAVGSLVRNLKTSHGAKFIEPSKGKGDGREISEIAEDEVPYLLELREKNLSYSSTLFAQDASVVPNPYEEDPNTGEALIALLDAAYEKGLSLVVCANRGVIEKALQIPVVKKKDWYPILLNIQKIEDRSIESEKTYEFPENKKNVFKNFKLETTILDNKSIISDGHLKSLVNKATDVEKWKVCDNCSANNICPFKANRDWLAKSEGLVRLNEVMRYGELMDGQALVFREATAMIALILAGNSRDYTSKSPCDWVHERIEKGYYFSLLARRIYMTIFRAYSPQGLKVSVKEKEKQIKLLLVNKNNLEELSQNALKGLRSEKIASETGLSRFLSYSGVFAQLDPVKENQGKPLERRWNVTCSNTSLIEDNLFISDLEKICFKIWADIENNIEKIGKKEIEHNYYRQLRRWITSVTYRLGFLSEGKILFEEELKDYEKIVSLKTDSDNDDLLDLKVELQQSLKAFVFGGNNPSIRLTNSLTVSGDSITSQLKPKIIPDENSASTRMTVKIGKGIIEISPQTYVWLNRISTTGLSPVTVPPEVKQIADDIRKRSASVVNYAFENEDIDIEITKPDNEVILLTREGNRYRRISE